MKHLRPFIVIVLLPAIILVAFAVSAAVAKNDHDHKTTICHKPENGSHQITVSNNALPAHFRHGDVLPDEYGDCP